VVSLPVVTMILLVTKDGVAFVAATKASMRLQLSGASGSVNSISVGGMGHNLLSAAIPTQSGNFGGNADTIAADINATSNPLDIIATSDGVDTVTLYLPAGDGAKGNGLTIDINDSFTTLTALDATFVNGVDAVGGMSFDFPALVGKISKPAGEIWQGTGLLKGTAGSTPGEASASRISVDGVLGSNGDLDMGSLAVEVGVIQTIATLSATQPKSK
jgi:hypothetical protein